MIQRQKFLRARSALMAATLLTGTFLTVLTLPADAHGGHGFGGRGPHGAGFAGGQRHGNDSYIEAASEERAKLLDTKLRSICRGC